MCTHEELTKGLYQSRYDMHGLRSTRKGVGNPGLEDPSYIQGK